MDATTLIHPFLPPLIHSHTLSPTHRIWSWSSCPRMRWSPSGKMTAESCRTASCYVWYTYIYMCVCIDYILYVCVCAGMERMRPHIHPSTPPQAPSSPLYLMPPHVDLPPLGRHLRDPSHHQVANRPLVPAFGGLHRHELVHPVCVGVCICIDGSIHLI